MPESDPFYQRQEASPEQVNRCHQFASEVWRFLIRQYEIEDPQNIRISHFYDPHEVQKYRRV